MKSSFVFFISLFAILTLVSCQSASTEQPAVIELLSPAAFMEAYQAEEVALLIDCRTQGEIARGKIEGAVDLDFRSVNFKNQATKLDTTKPIYIYCQSGGRSAAAAEVLKSIGFDEVHDMDGGYSAYSQD